MDAAERLVALHGFAVPLRQITLEAGQRNNSAIAYHFGTRQGLLETVWERRTARVNDERSTMLEQIEAEGRSTDLVELARAHVLPLTHEIGTGLPSYWARFNEVALARRPLVFFDEFDADLASYADREVPMRTLSRLFRLMIEAVGTTSAPTAALQVALTVRYVIAALAGWERDQERGLLASSSLQPFAGQLIETSVAMLTQPWGDLDEDMGRQAG